MGNIRNRKRKKARKPPSKKSKIFKHGEPCDNLTGLSGAIIGTQKETFVSNSANVDTVKKGAIFTDLSIISLMTF
jgi:hypothetical protein